MKHPEDFFANRRVGMTAKAIKSNLELSFLRHYKRAPAAERGLALVKEIYKEEQDAVFSILLRGGYSVLFSPEELFNIWAQAQTMSDHGGAFAEVGVFRGASAKIICESKGSTPLHLFDTFTGLPEVGIHDARFSQSMFVADEKKVKARLSKYPNVEIHAGLFPNTAKVVEDLKFSFVHLDVDLYNVTKDALEFFYSRMLPGGRIISHDYGNCEGVWRAFDEFIADKPEKLEPMTATQVLLIKK